MGFGQGLSGLNAAAQNLDVIGNNIANSATAGFKAGSASFADVFANSRVGLGVQLASVNQRFTTGTVTSTGNQFDMAIDGARGFFVVQNPNGEQFYTRNGEFFADKENRIVNVQGQQLMGYAAGTSNLIGMTVPVGNLAPEATGSIANKVNLDANDAVVPNASNPETVGRIDLTRDGMTTAYHYRITGGVYSWVDSTGTTAGPIPPAGTYMTDTSVAATPVTFTGGVPDVPLPVTGGNVAGGVVPAGAVGTVYLNGVAHYYRDDGAGGYVWYQDAAGTTVANTGDPGYPANGQYQSGAEASASVSFSSPGTPVSTLPAGTDNVAYVAPVTAVAFDPNNTDSFSNSTPITVYDSLGNEHRLTQYYTKRPAAGGNSVWEVNFLIDGQAPTSGGSTILTFDSAGRLISVPSSSTVTLATPGGAASPAGPLSINVDFAGSTQFGGSHTQNFIADGSFTGEYASTSVSENGEVVANYTNGKKLVIGTLALADFYNLQGLRSVGGVAWAETATSGQPIMGRPGSNGLATIKGQAIEESNVDLSQELVNMIIAQRTYQANAQTIKTQDQIQQTLITMR
ncbi:flagellar hook-basal body complex protein [Castellaniella sp. GW247-6E4]|uniref:flagellar hook-basal body complex protein n=1 Tax=Castellaniella sp. GW247-6E4 TaxID=3140380 RepID=UPI003315C56B